MSAPVTPLVTVGNPLSDSHNLRSAFEKSALIVFLCVAAGVCALAIGAALWMPAAPHQVDWAKSVLDRITAIKDVIFDMLTALGGAVGLSFGRGHMDARLQQKDGQ